MKLKVEWRIILKKISMALITCQICERHKGFPKKGDVACIVCPLFNLNPLPRFKSVCCLSQVLGSHFPIFSMTIQSLPIWMPPLLFGRSFASNVTIKEKNGLYGPAPKHHKPVFLDLLETEMAELGQKIKESNKRLLFRAGEAKNNCNFHPFSEKFCCGIYCHMLIRICDRSRPPTAQRDTFSKPCILASNYHSDVINTHSYAGPNYSAVCVPAVLPLNSL